MALAEVLVSTKVDALAEEGCAFPATLAGAMAVKFQMRYRAC